MCVQGISTYENPIDTHHRELYKLHLAQKAADFVAAAEKRTQDSPAAAAKERQQQQPIFGAREKCGDAFWWGATYKSWMAKKSGTEGSGAFHVRRKWEKRYFALQGNRLLWGRNPGKRDASAYIELRQETKIVLDSDPKGKGAALRFCVQNPGRVLWLEALNVDDRNDWVDVLEEVLRSCR